MNIYIICFSVDWLSFALKNHRTYTIGLNIFPQVTLLIHVCIRDIFVIINVINLTPSLGNIDGFTSVLNAYHTSIHWT